MAEENNEKTDAERREDGEILIRTIIEMLGAPKEHIEKTMKDYVEKKLKTQDSYDIVKEYYSPAELQEDKKLYSLYAELEIWFKNTTDVMAFCFDSLPSSVEILEPETLTFNANEFSGLINDLQAKLHKLDMELKNRNADKMAAGRTFSTLIQNFIVYCLKKGENQPEAISKSIGMDQDKITKILDDLVEKKVINKKDETYSL